MPFSRFSVFCHAVFVRESRYNSSMKKLFYILTFVVLLCARPAQAQDRLLDADIQFGLGGFSSTSHDAGAVIQASLGLDIHLNDSFSLMPFVGARLMSEGLLHIGAVGADYDFFNMVELGAAVRYHFTDAPVILSIAPYFSHMFDQDTYYVDADPSDPLNGQTKLRASDFGFKPGVYVDIRKHMRLGLEASAGLRNSLKQYPEYHRTGSWHANSAAAVLSFHF